MAENQTPQMTVVDSSSVNFDDYSQVGPRPSTGEMIDLLSTAPASVEFVRKEAKDLALMRQAMGGADFLSEYQVAHSQLMEGADSKELKKFEQEKWVNISDQKIMEFVRGNATSDDPETREMLATILSDRDAARQAMLSQAMDVDGAEMVLSQLYGPETTSEFRKRQENAEAFAHNMVAEWAEQFGVYDKIWDYTTTFLGLDEFKDASDLTGKGQFDSLEALAELSQEFQNLDPDEQVFIFPELFQRITEAYDNNTVKVGSAVGRLFSRNYAGDIALDGAFTALGIASLPVDAWAVGKALKATGVVSSAIPRGLAAVNAVKGLIGSRSVPKKMKDLGNDKSAAESATISGLDPKAGDVMGMTSLDAATTASPFRMEEIPVIVGGLDNISDEMAKLHRASVEQSIAQVIEERKSLRKGLTPTQKRRLEVAAVELPRQIERVKLDMRAIEKGINKIKSKKDKKLDAQLRVMEADLELKVKQFRALQAQMSDNTIAMARINRLDDINTELFQLRQGRTPTALSTAVREAVRAEQQARVVAASRATKVAEVKKARIEEMTAGGMPQELAEVALAAKMSSLSAKVLDNPTVYGLSKDFAEDLRTAVASPVQQTVKQAEELAVEGIPAAQREKVQQRVIDKLVKEAEAVNDNVRVADLTEMDGRRGFTVVYHRGGQENTLEYRYTLNDVGVFDGIGKVSEDVKGAMRHALSPEARFNDLDRFVDNLTFAGDQAARAGRRLQDIFEEANKGLSKQQREDVDALLIAGDEEGKVWTLEQLSGGTVETTFGKKSYDATTIDAYFRNRVFLDEMHSAREHFIRKELDFLGFKDMEYTDAKGNLVHFIGKPREDFRGADLTGQERIWIPNGVATGDKPYENMSQVRKFMGEWKDEGYKIVQLLEPHSFKDGSEVRFALVADGYGVKINGLPQKVLQYKPGYVPRVYRSGYYFVKDVQNPGRPSTLFMAETRDEAKKLADQSMAADPNLSLVVKGDREVTAAERMILDADSYGGLYTGQRKDNNLLVKTTGGEAYRPTRVTAGQATERYLQNMANMMPMNEYRATLMKQFANTVEALAEQEGRTGLVDKTDFMSSIDLSPGKKQMMEDTRDYLANQLSIPMDDEKLFSQRMQNLADSLYEGKKGTAKARELARAAAIGMIDKDPVQQLKGFTFNAQMGMFNVRQLMVQVQNAAIAAAVSPQHAPAALADALAMRTFIFADKRNMGGLIKEVAKVTGRSEKELREMADLFDQTGLWDSIKRTADYDANVVSMGTTMASVRKFAEKGRVFFTEGEGMARLISFNIARRKLGPKASVKEIFDEHLRLSMNMQSANAANWQKNWMGIPLQYMQVFTKFYERLGSSLIYGKGKWTRREAAQVLGMQVAAYGTIGVPFADDIYAYLAEVSGKTPRQVQEEMPLIQETWQEGAVGVMASILGFENNFSKDFSIVSGTFDNVFADVAKAVYEGVTTGASDLDAYRLFSGPSTTTIGRTWDAMSSIGTAATVLAEDLSMDTLGGQVFNVMDQFAAITSTWSGARKAIFLHDVGILSKKGNVLIEGDRFSDVSLQTQFARALNFETDIETSYWALKEVNRTSKKHQKEDLAALKSAHIQFMKTGNIANYKALQAVILEGKTPAERRRLIDSLNRGTTGDSDFDRQARQYFNEYILSGGRNALHPATAAQ